MSGPTERMNATTPEKCIASSEGVRIPHLKGADIAEVAIPDIDKILALRSGTHLCPPIEEDVCSVIELSDIDDSMSDFTPTGHFDRGASQYPPYTGFVELTRKNSLDSTSVSGEDTEMLYCQTWKVVRSVRPVR